MLRLSTLSRAHSINVRFTAPGHANPYFLDRAHFVDPSHPAARLTLRNLPAFVCPQFTIRAFPNAVLQVPTDFVPINPLLATGLVRARTSTRRQKWWSKLDTPTNATFLEKEGHRRWTNTDAMKRHKYVIARQLADARLAALAERGRHNVSLLFHTSKKATSKSCVIRRRLRSKMTAAIGLVVARNADAVNVPESDQPASPVLTSTPKQRPATPYPPLNLVTRPPQESERFVLQDWTYLVVPNLAIYRTPLPNLVQAVRKALLSLNHQSIRLESSWSALPKSNAVDSRLHRPHKVVTKSQSVTRTRPNRPHRSHPISRASAPAQGSDPPHEPAPPKHENVSTRLWSSHPIYRPRGE